jgi:hypothetical protein
MNYRGLPYGASDFTWKLGLPETKEKSLLISFITP